MVNSTERQGPVIVPRAYGVPGRLLNIDKTRSSDVTITESRLSQMNNLKINVFDPKKQRSLVKVETNNSKKNDKI